MTTNCINVVQPTLPPDVQLHPFTAPHPAPTAIESQVDAILSSAASFRALLPLQQEQNHEAMLVACYSDHALIRMLKEEFDIPVIGIMEASLFAARTLGSRIGLVATAGRSAIAHRDAFRRYGCGDYCAGIRACELGVLDLERLPREQVLARMADVARQLKVPQVYSEAASSIRTVTTERRHCHGGPQQAVVFTAPREAKIGDTKFTARGLDRRTAGRLASKQWALLRPRARWKAHDL